MAGMCCGVKMGETETTSPRSACRRKLGTRRFSFHPSDSPAEGGVRRTKRKMDSVVPIAAKTSRTGNTPPDMNRVCGSTTSCVPASEIPNFGLTSICGRRRDMEDAVAVHPNFPIGLHFFGVYDGHGCSHVAAKCRDRMHEIVKEEIENGGSSSSWEQTMSRSFSKIEITSSTYDTNFSRSWT